MDEVYVLQLVQEDYTRIYGIYSSYIEAETQKSLLAKYNEMCNFGELQIYVYDLNKTYTNEKPNIIE